MTARLQLLHRSEPGGADDVLRVPSPCPKAVYGWQWQWQWQWQWRCQWLPRAQGPRVGSVSLPGVCARAREAVALGLCTMEPSPRPSAPRVLVVVPARTAARCNSLCGPCALCIFLFPCHQGVFIGEWAWGSGAGPWLGVASTSTSAFRLNGPAAPVHLAMSPTTLTTFDGALCLLVHHGCVLARRPVHVSLGVAFPPGPGCMRVPGCVAA